MDREVDDSDPGQPVTEVYEEVEFLGRDESDAMNPDALDEVLKKAFEDCERNVLSRPVPDGQFTRFSIFSPLSLIYSMITSPPSHVSTPNFNGLILPLS